LTGGASGAQTDYQVKLTVTYDSDMKSDFSDLRFTNGAEDTLLDAWMESYTASTSAIVWVETDTPANTVEADIYMYYGNSGASSSWSGANTFLQYHGAATASFADSEILLQDIVYEARARVTGTNDDIFWGLKNAASANHMIRSRSSGSLRYGYGYSGSGGNYCSEAPKFAQNVWYRLLVEMKSARSDHYVDGNQIASGVTGYYPHANVGLYMTEIAGGGEQEWSFARKYVASPATYVFGSEEEPPSTGSTMWYYQLLQRRNN